MAEIVSILKRAENVTTAPKQPGYSMVRIHAGTDDNNEEIIYEAGDETGAVLEISNEFGTQAMAENILAEVSGVQYQPGRADGALVDPAAEVGDAINANNAYFGLYIRATEFGRLMKSDVEAPTDQEIEHEFGAETSAEREYIRFTGQVKSTLRVHAAEIAAKVSVESNNAETGFGWSLLSNKWTVGKYSGSTLSPVFTVDENGVYIVGSGSFTGTITATGGKIGGLTINQDGSIQSANGRFKVDAAGNLTATNGTFAGAVYAKNIQYGTSGGIDRGYFSGAGLSDVSVGAGKITPYDLTTGQFSGGVTTSLGYADLFNSATQLGTGTMPNYFYAKSINATSFFGGSYMVDQSSQWDLVTHKHALTCDANGNVSCGPARSGSASGGNFNIADTAFFKSRISAATINSGNISVIKYSASTDWGNKTVSQSNAKYYGGYLYATLKVTFDDGSYKTFNVPIDATDAVNAGKKSGADGVDVSYSGGSYDIWIDRWAYDSRRGYWVQIAVALTNGKTRYSTTLWLD